MEKCYTHYEHIGSFISNINGNWRNSIYITCSVCHYAREECCDDLLISFDAEGIPAVILAKDANFIFGTIVDKSECLCEMSNVKLQCLLEKFFLAHIEPESHVCPLLQLASGKKSHDFWEKSAK